jgi:hypothetical protein
MPPSAQVIVRVSNGSNIILGENDRIVKEVTIPCSSQRCASRHGQAEPVAFTFNDQDPFPEAGDQFLSLILPERSPSNPQFPLPFCGPQCLKDYLVYQYLAPGPRVPLTVQTAGEQPEIDPQIINVKKDGDYPFIETQEEFDAAVRKTDNPELTFAPAPENIPSGTKAWIGIAPKAGDYNFELPEPNDQYGKGKPAEDDNYFAEPQADGAGE